MKKTVLKILAVFSIMLIGVIACNKDNTSTSDSSSYTELAVYQLQTDCSLGKIGCYELVFPVTIQFPDQTTLTANSYDELKAGIKAWKEANEPASGRPVFVFPISVINQNGETIVVNTQDELKALREACKDGRNPGHRGHFARGLNCFDLVYPVTLVFPDASEKSVANSSALKDAIETWRKANPGVKNHPVLKFPFTVTLKSDNSTVTVSSKEDLENLKKGCRG